MLVAVEPDPIRKIINGARRSFWSMVGGSVDFSPQPLGLRVDPHGIAGYYSDLSGKTRMSIAEFPGSEYDWCIPIAQFALGNWERHLAGDGTEAQFRAAVELLLSRSSEEGSAVVWRNGIAVPKYGLSPGWISAMGQGQAISVLLRAHLLTGERHYLEIAERALQPLLVQVADGGSQRQIGGVTVLEEYPTEKPCAVLNGWIFALWGVHELSLVSSQGDAGRLFERSAAGVVELLPRYDVGWWSRYSLYDYGRPDLAKPFYQQLHPVMLEGLGLITGNPVLTAYADRWRNQRTRLAYARVAVDKLAFRFSRGRRSG
jgi:heparosan-N-sulfate-glucuronate 5-epimerase